MRYYLNSKIGNFRDIPCIGLQEKPDNFKLLQDSIYTGATGISTDFGEKAWRP